MNNEEPTTLYAELKEHAAILAAALHTYHERSEAYGQAWRNYGAVSNLLSAARKIDRLMETWYHDAVEGKAPSIHKDALDDAYDALNYLVFFIRNCQRANFTGGPPERPEEVSAVAGWILSGKGYPDIDLEEQHRRHPSSGVPNNVISLVNLPTMTPTEEQYTQLDPNAHVKALIDAHPDAFETPLTNEELEPVEDVDNGIIELPDNPLDLSMWEETED